MCVCVRDRDKDRDRKTERDALHIYIYTYLINKFKKTQQIINAKNKTNKQTKRTTTSVADAIQRYLS